VCTYKGRRFIHAKAIKAIYGTLRAALLFYQVFSGELKKWRFLANPYDACTMNKIVNGKQLTIVCHVDDCKISHEDRDVVDDTIRKLKERFGNESSITVTCGKVHGYLGMTIDYSTKGEVKFYMYDYIKQVLSEVDSSLMCGSSTSPATRNLFTINDEGIKLGKKDADAFHRNVTRLLFLSK